MLPNIETNIVPALRNARSAIHCRNVYAMWKMYAQRSREYYIRKDNEAKANRAETL